MVCEIQSKWWCKLLGSAVSQTALDKIIIGYFDKPGDEELACFLKKCILKYFQVQQLTCLPHQISFYTTRV